MGGGADNTGAFPAKGLRLRLEKASDNRGMRLALLDPFGDSNAVLDYTIW